MESWTRDLGLDITVTGPIGAPTLDGAKYKLKLIKDNDGRMTHSEVV